jgi:hypothetical protein
VALDKAALEALVATVPEQASVYASDLAAAEKAGGSGDPREIALDGVAHYVFNTLRGVEDTIDGATFEDVRAIVAQGGF